MGERGDYIVHSNNYLAGIGSPPSESSSSDDSYSIPIFSACLHNSEDARIWLVNYFLIIFSIYYQLI